MARTLKHGADAGAVRLADDSVRHTVEGALAQVAGDAAVAE